MKKKWLLLALFLNTFAIGFSQSKIEKIDLSNPQQIHVLKMKNGERYVGTIVSMSSRIIVFKIKNTSGDELTIHRKNISILSSFTPSDDNNGVLRKPFKKLQKTFPNIEFDPRLNVKDYSQQVRIVSKGKIYFGRIRQVRNAGIQVLINKEIEFFPFVNISKIAVEEWSYLDIASPDYDFQTDSFDFNNYAFQVDSFLTEEKKETTYFDPEFDLNNKNHKHVILTQEGDRWNGKIKELTSDSLVLVMDNGSIVRFDNNVLEEVEVHKIGYFRKETSKGIYYKKYAHKYFEDANYILAQNRLLVSQTGFGLKKGETEYRSTQVFFNSFDYGATDNFTFGIGAYPLIGDNVLTGRLNFTVDYAELLHLSGGAQIYYTLGGFANSGGEGAFNAHLALSMGSPTAFLNVAYNHWEGLDGFEKGDIWSVGFSLKTSESYRIFADVLYTRENEREDFFFFRENTEYAETIISGGMSWFNVRNKVDFGLTYMPGSETSVTDNFWLFPFVSYVLRI